PFCKLAGARTIASRRDMGFWYSPGILRSLRISNRFVDTIVANAEAVRRNVSEVEHYPSDRIMVVPNGHPTSRFALAPLPGFRESLSIPSDAFVVGMVANLRPVKRPLDAVKAIEIVRRRGIDAHLVLVGKGELEDELRAYATTHGLGAHVHF